MEVAASRDIFYLLNIHIVQIMGAERYGQYAILMVGLG